MRSKEALHPYSNKEILNRTKFIGWPSSIGIKNTWYSSNGFRLSSKPTEQNVRSRRVAGRTARHEAKHAFPNPDNVKTVTIIPGPGYFGLTELHIPDPVAALAPDATGEDGTGWDVRAAISITGGNIGPASNVAKSIVNENAEEVEEVASVLEEKKTISGYEVKQAIDNVRNKRKVGEKATLFIKSPEGFEQRIPDVDVRNGIVILPPKEQVIPDKLYELPKEGIIFSRN